MLLFIVKLYLSARSLIQAGLFAFNLRYISSDTCDLDAPVSTIALTEVPPISAAILITGLDGKLCCVSKNSCNIAFSSVLSISSAESKDLSFANIALSFVLVIS